MTEPSISQLRALVRAQVVEVLQRLQQQAPASTATATAAGGAQPTVSALPEAARQLLVLFMGTDPVGEEFYTQLDALTRQGFTWAGVFSHSFTQCCPPERIRPHMPAQTTLLAPASERELLDLADSALAIVAPGLSRNTAAKLATGIEDSLPSQLISRMLLLGKPVFVAQELAQLGRVLSERFPHVPPALLRIAEDHFHKAQQLGLQFVAPTGVARQVACAFHVEPNLTPERLAKQRPVAKREFVTVEDLWAVVAMGKKELVHSRNAIITDQAREFASAQGITLRLQ